MIGSSLIPIALLIDGFANLTLPIEMQKASPLVPALQSNWLMMHVSMMMLSYATLIIGSLLSILFLVISKGQEVDFNLLENSKLSLQKSNNLIVNNTALAYEQISFLPTSTIQNSKLKGGCKKPPFLFIIS